jgi:ribosomal protein S18 acetylase RimI-like enzyme
MTPGDLARIVQIHLDSFPGFFLTFLGPRFLKLLYSNVAQDSDGIVLIAEVNDKVIGFVVGITHQTGFYWRLIQRQKWAFAWTSLGAVLRRPTIVPRLWRALRRPSDATESAAEACLMSIAVHPHFRGQGIGKQLVLAFCREIVERGESAICLTTDRDHNEAVNHFYQRLGFDLSRSFTTPEGRAMNEYIWTLRE